MLVLKTYMSIVNIVLFLSVGVAVYVVDQTKRVREEK